MIHNLFYGDNNLLDIGFTIKTAPVYSFTERSVEIIETEGADGDTIKDKGRYKNYPLDYEVNSIPFFNQGKTNQEIAYALKDWLFAFGGGYKRLSDTYNPGYFCYAYAKDAEKVTVLCNGGLETTLHFTAKPYLYSFKGEEPISFENNETTFETELFNPENCESEPYIKVSTNGSFKLTVGDITMAASDCSGYLEFDSQTKHVHKNGVAKDYLISGDYMPLLRKGVNTITVESLSSNVISGVEIIPRWRRL